MGIKTEYRLKEKYNHNILSVIFDSDSFFYGISDVNNELCIACKYELGLDPEDEIAQIITDQNLANHYYSAVNIFSKSSKFTFVPISEYSYGSEGSFIHNSFDYDEDSEMIAVDLCSEEQLHIIHAYETSFLAAFSALKENVQFRHLSLAYIQACRNDGVYVNVLENKLTIMVKMNGQFKYFNQFDIQQIDEFLYFVMLAYDQLRLDHVQVETMLFGEDHFVKIVKEQLEKYVSKVLIYKEGFVNKEDSSDIMDLYLASICE